MKKSFIKLLTIILFASAPVAHVCAMEEVPAQEAQEDPMMQDPLYAAITVAAQKNNLEPLRELLRAGVDAKRIFEFPASHAPAISFAISLGSNENSKAMQEIVSLLLEYGADINALDSNGITPLMIAAFGGSVDIAALLIMCGAGEGIDTKSREQQGLSALFGAVCRGHLKMADLLIKSGAQIDIQNDMGLTPFNNGVFARAFRYCEIIGSE